MNQKKILFICVITAAIAVVSGIIATASPRLNSSNFGQAVNEILKNTDDTGIVAVDGIEITKTDLNLLKNEYATTDPQKDISDKEIIDELIRKQVVLNEAENLGISVSYEEAEEEFYYNYNLIKDAVDNGDKYAEQALDAINQYRKARGMSESEYIEAAIPEMQKIMTEGEMYTNFKATLDQDTLEDVDLVYELYQEYIDDLVADADIIYLNHQEQQEDQVSLNDTISEPENEVSAETNTINPEDSQKQIEKQSISNDTSIASPNEQ